MSYIKHCNDLSFKFYESNTLHALGIISSVNQQWWTLKCPHNTSVKKRYKLLLHWHNSAQFSIMYGPAAETETYP